MRASGGRGTWRSDLVRSERVAGSVERARSLGRASVSRRRTGPLSEWTFGPEQAAAIRRPVLSVIGAETQPLWVEIAEFPPLLAPARRGVHDRRGRPSPAHPASPNRRSGDGGVSGAQLHCRRLGSRVAHRLLSKRLIGLVPVKPRLSRATSCGQRDVDALGFGVSVGSRSARDEHGFDVKELIRGRDRQKVLEERRLVRVEDLCDELLNRAMRMV